MIFLMMAAHDTSTSTATTMAYHLAANPEWQERCRDESARLGDGPLDIEALEKLETLDLVMNESLRLVTPLPMNYAADRARHRSARLLPPGGHQRRSTWPGMNHRLAGAVDRSGQVRPRPVRRAAQRAQEAPLRVRAVRRRRAQVHRHGVRSARGQDRHAPAVAPLSPRAGPPRITQPRYDYGGMPVPMDGMPIVLRPLR